MAENQTCSNDAPPGHRCRDERRKTPAQRSPYRNVAISVALIPRNTEAGMVVQPTPRRKRPAKRLNRMEPRSARVITGYNERLARPPIRPPAKVARPTLRVKSP